MASSRLVILHVLIITLSNALVNIPLEIFGYRITGAAFVFPFVIIATDLTVRILGPGPATKTIIRAYPFAIVSSIIIVFLEGKGYETALRIGLASGTSYAVGSFIDAKLFQKIRENISVWWAAPALSTVVSNIIDTFTFFSVAFYNSPDPYMAANWPEIAITQTCIKILIGLFFFLPLYKIFLKHINKIS
tara:strand:+ start:1536 stop:2105 length:570 start_codon:yes stop_codon:yes gene_type:complete